MNNAIIFDIDGTLWDAREVITNAWNKAMLENGLPPKTIDEIEAVLGLTNEQIMYQMLGEYPDELRDNVFNTCLIMEKEYLNKIGGNLYPDEVEVLQLLAQQGFKLMILTNAGPEYVNNYLSHSPAASLFCDSLSNGENGKNKAENIRILMERNHIDKACYVGDTIWDQEYSQQAGVPFVWARYGFGHDLDCEFIIDSFKEIPEVIKQIF